MEVAKQISGASKNVDLLERWAQADSGGVRPDGTPIKNVDLLERWARADSGRFQPDGTPIKNRDLLEGPAQKDHEEAQPQGTPGRISPRRLSDETEQTKKRPYIRLVLALVSTIICIGGVAKLGSLNQPMEGSTASSEITRSMMTLQSGSNIAAGEQTSSEAPPQDATAGILARSDRFQSDRSQIPHAMSSADEAKLLARAESLIKQFDFTGARLLLTYALEKGSARAAFMMAETYDWKILRSLPVYGVRGDAQRARELYQIAAAAGIEGARERAEASQSDANFDAGVGGENRSR
jgi:hypothetical protein